MPKIMIIKYQQFAKTNTFSLSFPYTFFPHFCTFFPRHIEIRIWGWAKMGKNGVEPPPPPLKFELVYVLCTWIDFITKINRIKV